MTYTSETIFKVLQRVFTSVIDGMLELQRRLT